MSQDAIDILLRSIKSLRESGEYSDLQIFCGDETFSVHKAIICPRSEFFSKACSWGKDVQPKSEIHLEDDDPKIVKLMIDYLYRLDYDELPISEECTTVPVLSGIEVDDCKPSPEEDLLYIPNFTSSKIKNKKQSTSKPWHNADWTGAFAPSSPMRDLDDNIGFGMGSNINSGGFVSGGFNQTFHPLPRLDQRFARTRLQDLPQTSSGDRTVIDAQLYALADKYGIDDLKQLAKTKFTKAAEQGWRSEAFVQAARVVFETTPSSDMGLRSVVLNTLNSHRQLMDFEEVHELLDSGNGIAWQLVKVLLGHQ